MTIRERVERTKLGLETIAALSAILWGVAAAFGTIVIADLLRARTSLPGAETSRIRAFAVLVGLGVTAFLLWRARFVWMLDRVALWIEERAPELRYSLVTAADARYEASLAAAAIQLIDRVNTDRFVRRAALKSVGPAALAAAAALALVLFIPDDWRRPLAAPSGSAFNSASSAALLAGSRLTPLTARVAPPAYTGLGAEKIAEPSTVAGVQGSTVTLEGSGSPRGISGDLRSTTGNHTALLISAGGRGWRTAFVLRDTTPAYLELTDGKFKRAIVINPRADAAPTVKLRLPARDTALRAASGTLQLEADVSDDIGLDAAQFEYIVSSGAEETFTFKQGVHGARTFGGEKTGKLTLSLPYSYFHLGEGDRLSIRATASDRNSLFGPSKGFSETRTIRVARKDEYDSLSVEAAPPSGDTAMMSLRMLIVETEKLEKARPKLARDTLVTRSRGLARQTDQVRAAVLPLARDEGDVSGEDIQAVMDTESTERSVEVTALVRAALNDLEDASRKLDVADPRAALPPMYAAYKALQSFRNFKRYYLRGATRPVIVDIQRVRLMGKTKGTATPMSGRAVATSDRDRMRAEYSAAIEQLRSSPGKSVTMLTMLRVEALRKYPALSAALEDALVAIGKGRDATPALIAARRLLEGKPAVADSIPAWSGW